MKAISSSILAVLLAGGVAACSGGSKTGTPQRGGGTPDDPQDGKPKATLFAAGCPLVDQAVMLKAPAARKPIVAEIHKLEKQVKVQADADFLMNAAVVAQAEGLPSVSYPSSAKTAVVKACADHGHPVKNVK